MRMEDVILAQMVTLLQTQNVKNAMIPLTVKHAQILIPVIHASLHIISMLIKHVKNAHKDSTLTQIIFIAFNAHSHYLAKHA